MAGPYHGAPFSIVAITSAKVGPFDLGTVVVREALEINPETAAVTVDAKASDPIPHIIQGIVVHVRDIRVYVNRPQFMINPTSCDPMSLAATVTGAGADPSNPADQQPVTVTSPFQLANCQNLAFKPLFQVSTSGRTSKANRASLNVKLAYPNTPQGTQANIRTVKVELPLHLKLLAAGGELPHVLAAGAANVLDQPAPGQTRKDLGHMDLASRETPARPFTPASEIPSKGELTDGFRGGDELPRALALDPRWIRRAAQALQGPFGARRPRARAPEKRGRGRVNGHGAPEDRQKVLWWPSNWS
jgi:hypothetical protein